MLKQPVRIEHKSEVAVLNANHDRIRAYCLKHNWKTWNVTVNGRPFAWKVKMVLDDLYEQGVIGKWQRQQIERGYYWRNVLSHLEFATLLGESAGTLRFVADLINQLFHV